MVRDIQFDSAFTFVYSTREGTEASKMEDQIDPETKKKRIITLNDIQNKISLAKNKEFIDTVQTVLVEGESKTDPNMFTGRTRTNKLVHFPSDSNLVGKLIKVKITEAQPWSLMAEIETSIS